MVQCVCPPLHAAAPRHTTQSFGRLALRQGRVFVRSLKVEAARTGPVVVIDNYDSFTYNLVQVSPEMCWCIS